VEFKNIKNNTKAGLKIYNFEFNYYKSETALFGKLEEWEL